MPTRHKHVLQVLAGLVLACLYGCDTPGTAEVKGVDSALRDKAVLTLRTALAEEQKWVKVHAAEVLLSLDYPQGVEQLFTHELEVHGGVPQYRIGIWRVLSRAAVQSGKHDQWWPRIVEAYADPSGPDRLHAAETLAKLGRPLGEADEQIARGLMQSSEPLLAATSAWIIVNADRAAGEARLATLVASDNPDARRMAAYALRFVPRVSGSTARLLADMARREPIDSAARVYTCSAAYVHAAVRADADEFKRELLAYLDNGSESQRYEAANALAARGGHADLSSLEPLLGSAEPDSRIGAAYAILRIGRRTSPSMTALDWGVVAVYALGMIGVGMYCMRRTKTTEDYLLGGRRMRSWTVGLSLFATLFSTITFLSIPGEMIKNGPMVLGQMIAFPLVYITIGWMIIPFFMRLRVTSAYQILHLRFGPSVRLLGSLTFLSVRLLWMAVIVYATTRQVLVPLLGIDPHWTPWLCAILGIITIAYTSIGGLRAVVLTDVIQTFILAGGAFVCLALITWSLGGVGAWLPTEWAPNWESPRFGFQTDARVALGWMVVGAFLWHFCTSASDQMVIQRYLATRDAPAARRVVLVSLLTTAGIIGFLALVGFGLLAYFRQNPHMLADGQTIVGNPDQLLPRYIVLGLPPGATGLVIAGLLAAAMSSLSAGLNSACSVITVDLIGYFSPRLASEDRQLQTARWISVLVGAVVVAGSSYVSIVPGNLLEIAYRVVNLFTVPLFILFGMAMFVPWATTVGTWTGTLASMAAAIAISFWEPLTGTKGPSFLLIMPVSLIVGMGSGMAVSLIPFSKARASRRDLLHSSHTHPAFQEDVL